jgi:hypothetical protein
VEKRNPPTLRDWQRLPEVVHQPTCYDARNPAMPWRPADDLLIEDADDREEARAWCQQGGHAGTIGACQKSSPTPAPTAPPAASPAITLTVLQQISNALAKNATQKTRDGKHYVILI